MRPCKVEILPFLFYLVRVVSSCATVNSPRGQQQDWMAEEDPAEGAAAHCFLQGVQLAVSSRHLFFIYLIILLQYDSETTRIWPADSFFSRFVVTQMFSFLSGASGPSASSWVPPFISPSLRWHHIKSNNMDIRLKRIKHSIFPLKYSAAVKHTSFALCIDSRRACF